MNVREYKSREAFCPAARKAKRFAWLTRRRIATMWTKVIYPEVTFGSGLRVEGLVPRIAVEGEFRAGTHLYLRAPTQRIELTVGTNAQLDIGSHVLINNGASIRAVQKISIGPHSKIGDGVAIYDTNFHEVEEGEGIFICAVSIGRNVWIGRASVILPGVVIGDNSVIGAGSVVTSSIPANSVAVGGPAKVVRVLSAGKTYIRR